MVLNVDYLNEQGILGFANKPDKIEANFKLLPTFEQSASQQRPKATKAFVIINTLGRWVIVYREQVTSPFEKLLYFLDFRYDIKQVVVGMFSAPLAEAILSPKAQFDSNYQEANDTVELILAESHELMISPNIFICTVDDQVIKKADLLGVLPILQAQASHTSTKACFADELKTDGAIENLYALFRFQGSTRQGEMDERVRVHEVERPGSEC